MRVTVVPLLGILYASYITYYAVSFLNPEIAAISAGIVAASLIGLVYVAPMAYVSLRLLRIRGRLGKLRNLNSRMMLTWLGGNLVLLIAALISGSGGMIGFAAASTVLASLSLGAVAGVRGIARIQLPVTRIVLAVFALKDVDRNQRYY